MCILVRRCRTIADRFPRPYLALVSLNFEILVYLVPLLSTFPAQPGATDRRSGWFVDGLDFLVYGAYFRAEDVTRY